jgi:hypothetical protein
VFAHSDAALVIEDGRVKAAKVKADAEEEAAA